LVVVDSLSAAPIEAELNGEDGATTGLVRAKMLTKLLRRLAGACDRNNTTIIFVNHAKVAIGGMKSFGPPPKTTTGGDALKFYASIRVEFKIKEQVKRKVKRPDGTEDNAVFASKIEVHVLKNKLAPPFRKESFYIFFGRGSSNAASLLDIAVEQGFVDRTGTGLFKFRHPVQHVCRGLLDAIRYIETNPQVLNALCAQVFKVVPDLAPLKVRHLFAPETPPVVVANESVDREVSQQMQLPLDANGLMDQEDRQVNDDTDEGEVSCSEEIEVIE
jgi:recombination protein RecA